MKKNAPSVQKTTTTVTNTSVTVAIGNLKHYKQTNLHRGGTDEDNT